MRNKLLEQEYLRELDEKAEQEACEAAQRRRDHEEQEAYEAAQRRQDKEDQEACEAAQRQQDQGEFLPCGWWWNHRPDPYAPGM